jgi:extracellular elastinolytic metalloproteinase
MVSSFFSLLLATLLATYVEAAPWPGYTKHSTHRRRTLGKRAVQIESYHPKNSFKVFLLDHEVALFLSLIISRYTVLMDLQYLLEVP